MTGKLTHQWIMTWASANITTPSLPLLVRCFTPLFLLGPDPKRKPSKKEDEPDQQPSRREEGSEEIIPEDEDFEEEDWAFPEEALEEEDWDIAEGAFEEDGLPGEGGTDNVP
jgi:hypothetical protein